jgi:beta-alanine--pyruvate transaminase
MATLDIYEQERLFERPKALYPHWESSAMSLKGVKHVIDVRCFALIGAIEMAPRPGEPGARGAEAAKHCYDNGAWVRAIGDSLVLSPPLIISEEEITDIFTIIHDAIEATA